MSSSSAQHNHDWRQWVSLNLPGLVLLALAAAAVYYAYFVQIVNPYHNSTYIWLTAHWQNVSHYSHGPLIPLIAAGLLWRKRDQFRKTALQPHYGGVGIVALAMAIYYTGVKGGQERFIVVSFVVLLYGLALAVGGHGVAKLAFFPIAFLFLMIPLNFLEERVAVPLQHLMAICSTAILNVIGIVTQRVGTSIRSEVFYFNVDKPCSGIQSLMALTTVTAFYAYVTQHSQWKRWVLFLTAIPLAVLGNMVRVVLIAVLARIYGQKIAMQVHDSVAGYIVFAVALALMVLCGWLLDRPYRQIWRHWTQPVEPRTAL
jgi:exosortase